MVSYVGSVQPALQKSQGIFGLTDVLVIPSLLSRPTRRESAFREDFLHRISGSRAAAWFCSACWLAIGYWFNIYEKLDSAHPSVVFRDTFRQCVLGAACLVMAEFVLRLDLSRFFVLLFAVYAWILLCLFRINAGRVIGAVRREFGTAHYSWWWAPAKRARLGRGLEESADYGVRLLGFLDDSQGQIQLSQTYERIALSQLPDLLRQHVIDEIIFAVDSSKLGELEDVFLLCDEEGVRTRVVVDFFPHVNSQVYLDRWELCRC